MTGPGNLQTLNAGDGNSENWFEQAAGRGSSMVGASQDLADASSPPEWGVATVSMRMEQLELLTNPGQALMSNGLGFLVSIVLSPLIELAEFAIGDPEQMRSTGEGWENVAKWLDQVGAQEQQRAQATAETWVGKDGDAFRNQMTEFGDGVNALAADVRDLKGTLDMIADIFDMFVEFFIQTVTELIIGLIVQWLAALAASWITAGASVGAASAGTAVQVGATGVRITTRVTQMQRKLFQIFQKIEHLLQRLREAGKLRKVIDKMNEMRDGNMIQQAIARKIDSNPVAKFLTKADGDGLGSTGGKFLQDVTKQHADTLRDFDDRIAAATDSSVKEALQSQRDDFVKDVKDVQGLASTASSHVLSGVLGGKSTVGQAAMVAGTEVATDAAVEQGANAVYDTGKGWFQGDLSGQQRDQVQERGFS
ncbi:WXG100 family type VII secretion target [Saccharopolyspora sp. 5N708]|uniref:WXG100 family type VII secretion target n=1 Tax=Saccharopolyspora sp. 5N708 TaxID=3457424 RepID=UPI003FD13126